MEDKSIQEARRRAFRYYYEDGVVEISIGGFFTVIGLLLWVFDVALAGGRYAWLLGLGVLVITFGGVFAVKGLVMRLKANMTYPRTGQVTYDPSASRPGRWILVAAAILVMVAVTWWLPAWLNESATAAGFLMAVVLAYMGLSVGLVRMQIAAVVPLAAAILGAYLEWGVILGNVGVFVATGLVLFVMGLLALRGYLRENPVEDEEA